MTDGGGMMGKIHTEGRLRKEGWGGQFLLTTLIEFSLNRDFIESLIDPHYSLMSLTVTLNVVTTTRDGCLQRVDGQGWSYHCSLPTELEGRDYR